MYKVCVCVCVCLRVCVRARARDIFKEMTNVNLSLFLNLAIRTSLFLAYKYRFFTIIYWTKKTRVNALDRYVSVCHE